MQSILIESGILNAGNHTLTLSATTPLENYGTFNAGTSTVKLSDADHTFETDVTFYNLQWATPLTAHRTITVNGGVTITKATGGTFNLDGPSPTILTFFEKVGAGTASIIPAPPYVDVYYCGWTEVSGITCRPDGPPSSGGGTTPIPASVESDLAFVLTFLGIVLFAAFKMRKNKA